MNGGQRVTVVVGTIGGVCHARGWCGGVVSKGRGDWGSGKRQMSSPSSRREIQGTTGQPG